MAAVAKQTGTTYPPNPTQVKTLEERIKIEQLKETFSEYGSVIDLVAKRNLKAKGQAFIFFVDVNAAERGIKEVQGFELFEKPMILDYAQIPSDASVQRKDSHDDFDSHKHRRLAGKDVPDPSPELLKRPLVSNAVENGPSRHVKASRGASLRFSNPGGEAVVPEEYLPPNKILFVQNLPEDYDIGLTGIFGRFEGSKEVRLVPGRKVIAFVEYAAEARAFSAKESTTEMALRGDEDV